MLSLKLSACSPVAARPSRLRVVRTQAVLGTEKEKAKTLNGAPTKTRPITGEECAFSHLFEPARLAL